MIDIPPEFVHLVNSPSIPWKSIIAKADERLMEVGNPFVAFSETVITIASKESIKKQPNVDLVLLGMEAALARGRIIETLFLSSEIEDVRVLSLRAIALFVASDIHGLQKTLSLMETIIPEDAPTEDRVRLATVKVLVSAANQDSKVIMSVMEFDNMLETYPEQMEKPLIETMFTLYVIGTLFQKVGEVTRATRLADTLETMGHAIGHRMILALVENLRGNICYHDGHHHEAERHYFKFKKMSEEMAFELGIGMALNNIGSIRLYSFQLEEAMEFFAKAIEHMELDSARQVALINLGELTTILGKYDEAEAYFKKAIKLEEKTKQGIIETYVNYILLLVRRGKIDQSIRYLKHAQELVDASGNTLQRCALLRAKAIVAAAKNEFDSAVSILETALDIAKEKKVLEFIIKIKLELARTNMTAYENENDTERLAQAIYHIDDIIQIAKEQKLSSLHGYALLLKSDLSNLSGRLIEGKGYLNRALTIARINEDATLEREVVTRIESSDLPTYEEMMERGIADSFDKVSIFRPPSAIRKVPQPTLHALMAIDKESGLTEFVYYFDQSLELDSSIIAGFISAVGAFSGQMMGSSGNLRSITHEGFTLMMEYTEKRIITLIATDESFELRYRLREFASVFESKFPSQDNLDSVEPSRYKEADSLIESIFADIVA